MPLDFEDPTGLFDYVSQQKALATPTILPAGANMGNTNQLGQMAGQVPGAVGQQLGLQAAPLGTGQGGASQGPNTGASLVDFARRYATLGTLPQMQNAQQMGLPAMTRNPQLPAHPLGAYTDAQFEAEDAMARFQTQAAYNDILQQLGYSDPSTGQHIQGDVEQTAERNMRDFQTQDINAVRDVTGQMQQAGTLFSGYRGTAQARAEQPYVQGAADLQVDLPKALSRLTEKASDLVREYEIQRNMLLVSAAQRRLAALQKGGGGGGAGAGAGAGAPTDGETSPPEPNAGQVSYPLVPGTETQQWGGIPWNLITNAEAGIPSGGQDWGPYMPPPVPEYYNRGENLPDLSFLWQ